MNIEEVIVTSENIEEIKEHMPCDQRREIIVGCRTWSIVYTGSCYGQMTVWPNNRAAVEFGGDSIWGEWAEMDQLLYTEDYDAAGNTIAYDNYGEQYAITDSGSRVKPAI